VPRGVFVTDHRQYGIDPNSQAAIADRIVLWELGRAVQAYKAKHGRIPRSLAALVADPDHIKWLRFSGDALVDPVHGKPYSLIVPARSDAEFEIDDSGGIEPIQARGYPGAPGNSFVFDSRAGIIVRKL